MFFGLLDEGLLLEGVDSNDIIDAIKNHHIVTITYNGPDSDKGGSGKRMIYPFVYGKTTAGNDAIRAYQPTVDSGKMPAPNPESFSGHHPAWRLFLVDRITSWQDHTKDPEYTMRNGKRRPERYIISGGTYKEVEGHYNSISDKQMSTIIAQASIPGLKIVGRNMKGATDNQKETLNTRKQGMKDILAWYKEYKNREGENDFDDIRSAYQQYVQSQDTIGNGDIKRLSEILAEYEKNGWKGDLLAFIKKGGNQEITKKKSGVVTKSGEVDNGAGNDDASDDAKSSQVTNLMAAAQNTSQNNDESGVRDKSGNVVTTKDVQRDKYAKYSNIKSMDDLVKGVVYPAGFFMKLLDKEIEKEKQRPVQNNTNINRNRPQQPQRSQNINNTQQQQQPNTYQPQNTQIRNRRNKH